MELKEINRNSQKKEVLCLLVIFNIENMNKHYINFLMPTSKYQIWICLIIHLPIMIIA